MFVLYFPCPADHVPDKQPRVLLGMAEAPSIHVKTHTNTQHTASGFLYLGFRSDRSNYNAQI